MLRILPLLVLLAACGADAPQRMGKPPGIVQDAQRVRVMLEMRQLATDLEQHHALRGEWPDSWRAIRRSGIDPWGAAYTFRIDGDDAIVCSAGPDGESGTDDDIVGE